MRHGIICLILILCMGVTGSYSNQEERWKSLFDGISLSGWIIDEGNAGRCYVEDNAIVGDITQKMYFLRSEKKYGLGIFG